MATASLLLPGDAIPTDSLPTSKKTLKLGPGIRHTPPSTLLATTPGTLITDPKRNALWLENSFSRGGRYIPTTGDLVIGTVLRSTGEYFSVSLADYTTPVVLPHLAFEGATKKTRPQLSSGDLVYARVLPASSQTEAEIQCYNENTGKAEGMGPLKGGMLFEVSCSFARRVMMPAKKGGVVVLQVLAEKTAFEVAVGRNGRVWVGGESVGIIAVVGRALVLADERELDEEGQRQLVKKLLKGL